MKERKVSFGRMLFALGILSAQIYSLILLFSHHTYEGVSLATITFGDTAAPSDIAKYFDALFTQSLANSRGLLVDQIGASNAFLHMIMKSDSYESADGGTHIEEELMYALSPMESYDGFDELSTAETDGVTAAIYEWRQLATPVTYSMKQIIQNRRKIINLVKTKMTQCSMGIEEGFSSNFMRGGGDALIDTPKTNPINGSLSIEPLGKLVKFDPTTSTLIGNINQSTSTWWRNQTKTSASGTNTGSTFIAEWMNIYNTCALGTGGAPDICLADQQTYEIASMSLYQKYRQTSSDTNFPFTNIRIPFGNGQSLLVMDDKVPDAFSNLTSTATFGTMYLLNSKFFKIRPIEGRDFEMLEDENGKVFTKPANQDARVGHCAWMGQVTVNNRRKHGVWGKIQRSAAFTFS
jgi:hypothetical protein